MSQSNNIKPPIEQKIVDNQGKNTIEKLEEQIEVASQKLFKVEVEIEEKFKEQADVKTYLEDLKKQLAMMKSEVVEEGGSFASGGDAEQLELSSPPHDANGSGTSEPSEKALAPLPASSPSDVLGRFSLDSAGNQEAGNEPATDKPIIQKENPAEGPFTISRKELVIERGPLVVPYFAHLKTARAKMADALRNDPRLLRGFILGQVNNEVDIWKAYIETCKASNHENMDYRDFEEIFMRFSKGDDVEIDFPLKDRLKDKNLQQLPDVPMRVILDNLDLVSQRKLRRVSFVMNHHVKRITKEIRIWVHIDCRQSWIRLFFGDFSSMYTRTEAGGCEVAKGHQRASDSEKTKSLSTQSFVEKAFDDLKSFFKNKKITLTSLHFHKNDEVTAQQFLARFQQEPILPDGHLLDAKTVIVSNLDALPIMLSMVRPDIIEFVHICMDAGTMCDLSRMIGNPQWNAARDFKMEGGIIDLAQLHLLAHFEEIGLDCGWITVEMQPVINFIIAVLETSDNLDILWIELNEDIDWRPFYVNENAGIVMEDNGEVIFDHVFENGAAGIELKSFKVTVEHHRIIVEKYA